MIQAHILLLEIWVQCLLVAMYSLYGFQVLVEKRSLDVFSLYSFSMNYVPPLLKSLGFPVNVLQSVHLYRLSRTLHDPCSVDGVIPY